MTAQPAGAKSKIKNKKSKTQTQKSKKPKSRPDLFEFADIRFLRISPISQGISIFPPFHYSSWNVLPRNKKFAICDTKWSLLFLVLLLCAGGCAQSQQQKEEGAAKGAAGSFFFNHFKSSSANETKRTSISGMKNLRVFGPNKEPEVKQVAGLSKTYEVRIPFWCTGQFQNQKPVKLQRNLHVAVAIDSQSGQWTVQSYEFRGDRDLSLFSQLLYTFGYAVWYFFKSLFFSWFAIPIWLGVWTGLMKSYEQRYVSASFIFSFDNKIRHQTPKQSPPIVGPEEAKVLFWAAEAIWTVAFAYSAWRFFPSMQGAVATVTIYLSIRILLVALVRRFLRASHPPIR